MLLISRSRSELARADPYFPAHVCPAVADPNKARTAIGAAAGHGGIGEELRRAGERACKLWLAPLAQCVYRYINIHTTAAAPARVFVRFAIQTRGSPHGPEPARRTGNISALSVAPGKRAGESVSREEKYFPEPG